jgi:hypothetical protein
MRKNHMSLSLCGGHKAEKDVRVYGISHLYTGVILKININFKCSRCHSGLIEVWPLNAGRRYSTL